MKFFRGPAFPGWKRVQCSKGHKKMDEVEGRESHGEAWRQQQLAFHEEQRHVVTHRRRF